MPPADDRDEPTSAHPTLVQLGRWPRIEALILRSRLETAAIPVMVTWSESTAGPVAALLVPAAEADFARAVVNEIEVDDEVPDTSPHAYLARIEEHLSAVAGLVEELRARIDEGQGGP